MSEKGSSDAGVSASTLGPFSRLVIEEDLPVMAWYSVQASIKPLGRNPVERISRISQAAKANTKGNAELTALGSSVDFDQLLEVASSGEPGTADSGLDFDELSMLDPEVSLASLRDSEDIVEFRPGCDRVMQFFKDAMYLKEMDSLQLHPNLQPRTYLSIHPLVPIMIRASQGWRLSGLHSSAGFYAYITKRLQEWPMNSDTPIQFGIRSTRRPTSSSTILRPQPSSSSIDAIALSNRAR
jgi:hypothetical protein